MPKVSICIPTYNRSHYLKIALDSVFQQTYSDFEIIVCDDGSTDETPTLMSQFSDPRLLYIRHPENIGKSNNMRSGFLAATGEFFIKFDDDDRLTPTFLEQTVPILENNSQIDFVATDHWIINSVNQRDIDQTNLNSKKWGRTQLKSGIIPNLLEVIFIQQSIQIGATLFRYQALKDVDFMRSNFQSCEDNDLLVRLALAGKQAYYLPERLMEYRVHPEQQEIKKAIFHLRSKLRYLNSYQFDSSPLEAVRHSRLQETKLLLGLRLTEIGQTSEGQKLLWQVRSLAPAKTGIGLTISLFPPPWRPYIFAWLRQRQA